MTHNDTTCTKYNEPVLRNEAGKCSLCGAEIVNEPLTIKFYRKNVYGNELVYLIEGNGTDEVLALIGQKTIQQWQMRNFEALGIRFEETFQPRA